MVVNSDADSGKLRRVPADEDAIARFFSNLHGCEVGVSASRQEEFNSSGAVVAAYAPSSDAPEALCVFDLNAAAGLAVAATIIEPDRLERSRDTHRDGGLESERVADEVAALTRLNLTCPPYVAIIGS